ncbi:uncharacterized protein [Cicer arietinum]|uniref:Uncharacterized protein LOC101502064 n=1 Tax=Cicer arietinum TaxID=3827 RepID=A0A1S2XEJ5_CICAR|nr:uncharacterized protein LOC101502064 [Cicer arietinum]
MNILIDSNVEALAFNYLNFGLVTILNNLWTWLALLTAALSFWKIRSSGCPKSVDPNSIIPDPVKKPLLPFEDVTDKIISPRKTLTVGCDEVDGVRKGKFTVYYEEDMQCGRRESTGDNFCYRLLPVAEGWVPEERETRETEWWRCWEKVLTLRNGENENGWYTCQDLTELNGNVVKFWDGGCITKESWYGSSCMSVFVSE